jgi:tripartite-type tricarboxylate transporter receptor subunit TctC
MARQWLTTVRNMITGTALTLTALSAPLALAQSAGQPQSSTTGTYPDHPVRVIVPFAVGGGADIIARLVFQKLSEKMGQSFVIDNRGGAGGIVGTDAAAKARPDGYTLLLGQTGPNALNPNLFKKLPYDAVKDFAPVTQLTSYPYVIVVPPSLPVHNLQQLLELAKAEPGKLTYGSAGTGSSGQLAAELFQRTAGVKLNHVPYRGAGPALSDTLTGVLSMTFGDVASATPLVVAGQLRALAVTGTHRSSLLPDVPTAQEAGLKGYDATAWHAVLVPAGTPPEIVQKLSASLAEIVKEPAMRERLSRDGIEAVGSSPQDFATFIQAEINKWGTVIKEADIKLN